MKPDIFLLRILPTLLIALAGVLGERPASGASRPPGSVDSLRAVYERPVAETVEIDSTFALDDYLMLASERSPALRAAYYEWMSAVEKSDYAGSPPEPVFSYTRFIEKIETRVGPQNQRFSLRQSYPWFGTLSAREEMALEGANAAYSKFEAERLRTFYRAKAAFYEYYFLGRHIDLARENMELLKFWESVVRTKYKAALTQHPDVIRAQVELGKLEDLLLSLEDEVEPAAARLRAVLDLPDSIALPVPREVVVEERELNDPDVLKAVMEHNPDLQSLRRITDKEDAAIRLAEKSYFPDFVFGVDYIETGEAINPATPESGKDAWAVGIGVELPIWFGKYKAMTREAKARRMRAGYKLQEAENKLKALAEKAKFEHDDALRKVRLYRDGLVPKAEQSLNASYTAYQAGELDFLNVLDAQRRLLDFQLQLERSISNLGIKQAEIEMITGRPIGELAL